MIAVVSALKMTVTSWFSAMPGVPFVPSWALDQARTKGSATVPLPLITGLTPRTSSLFGLMTFALLLTYCQSGGRVSTSVTASTSYFCDDAVRVNSACDPLVVGTTCGLTDLSTVSTSEMKSVPGMAT